MLHVFPLPLLPTPHLVLLNHSSVSLSLHMFPLFLCLFYILLLFPHLSFTFFRIQLPPLSSI